MKKLSQVVVVALALAACLVGPLALWAQGSGRVDGRVLRDDGSGMGGVTVSVDGTSLVTLTDADGRFSIGGVPEGAQRLTFTAAEFTDGADVTVTAGSAVTLDKTVDWDMLVRRDDHRVTRLRGSAERIVEAPAAVTVVGEEEIAPRGGAPVRSRSSSSSRPASTSPRAASTTSTSTPAASTAR